MDVESLNHLCQPITHLSRPLLLPAVFFWTVLPYLARETTRTGETFSVLHIQDLALKSLKSLVVGGVLRHHVMEPLCRRERTVRRTPFSLILR
jgi:hypothetical protein